MSIKTLRKRIALVAVSALGVGLLSVAPASAADPTQALAGYATVTEGDVTNECAILKTSSGYVYSDAEGDDITAISAVDNVSVTFTTTDVPAVRKGDTVTTNTADASGDVTAKIVIDVDTNATGGYHFTLGADKGNVAATATTGTYTVVEPAMSRVKITGTSALPLQFELDNVTVGDFYRISGAPVAIITAGYSAAPTLSAGGAVNFVTDAATISVDLTEAPGYTGTFTITSYGADSDRVTAVSSVTATVSTTCEGASTGSAKDSYVEVNTLQEQADSNVDVATTTSAGTYLYANIVLNNAIGNPVAEGLWAATVTNGAKVSLKADGTAPGTPTYAFVTASGTGEEVTAKVDGGKAGAYNTTTLTVTYNGAVVTTKNLVFLGEATKINVIKTLTGKSSDNGYFFYTLTDAAGNQVPGAIELDSLTASPRTPSITKVNNATPLEPAVALGTLLPKRTYGVYSFSCVSAAGSGSTDLTIKHTSDYNENVLTASVKAVCAGPADTYTMSMDKAAYKIGEVATMTISAKDSSGAAVADIGSFADATQTIKVSAGGMEQVGEASNDDTFTGGVKTYKFQVTEAGTFNAVAEITGTTTKSATAAYTVTGGDVAMSEVLSAIVKLIASINEQIALLQKQLAKATKKK